MIIKNLDTQKVTIYLEDGREITMSLDYGKKNEKPANKASDGPDFGEIDLDDLPF